MAVYNIIPNQFIADDVRDTLNANGGSVGNSWLDYFGAGAKINKWSKHKPVIQPFNFAPNANWYKANDGFCGFSVGWATAADSSLTNLVNAYKAGTWLYKLPTGGASSPFRMSDFAGYDPNAIPFASSKMAKGKTYEVNVMENNALTLFVYYNDSATSVQIEDFDNAAVGLSTAHLGAALYNGNPLEGNPTRLQTVISNDPINRRGTVTFNFTQDDISTARWVMFFLASTSVSNNICIPYDDNNYFLFKINIKQEFLIRITPTMMGNGSLGYHEVSYYGTNNFPSSNGYADVIFFFSMKNSSSSYITVGSASSTDYALRTNFSGIYTTALTRCDSSGAALNDNVTINAGQTFSGYYKAPRMFLDFVNSFSSSTGQLRGQLYIEAYNKKGGAVAAWQTVSSGYMIYVAK